MNDLAPFEFTRHGRSWPTLLAVVVTWLACLIGFWVFDAAIWLVGVVLVFTLPALWDLYAGTQAGARLTDTALHWYSGENAVDVPLEQIDHVRLVTRLDLSVRAAVVLTSGRKLRLPPEATPPHELFEAALQARRITTQRHHFSFL